MANTFWHCNNCGLKFRRETMHQRVCGFCKEQTLTRNQEHYHKNNWYEKIKTKVKDRDKNRCVICHTTENLIVHHWDKVRTNNEPSNLITFCRGCHARVHRLYFFT